MKRRSGWCNGPDGCNSVRAHETCGDRLARGLLSDCGCDAHGGHSPLTVTPETVGAAWDNDTNESGPASAATDRGQRPHPAKEL